MPITEYASVITKNNKVGVIGTEGTVRSGTFIRELTKLNNNLKVFQKACPLFVPIIENGNHNDKFTDEIIEFYLKDLVKKDIDTLILGCTHYKVLENKIKKFLPKSIKVIDERKVVANKLKDYLKRHYEIEKVLSKKSKREFNSTDITEKFEKLGSKFFGEKIKVKKVEI